MATALLKKQTRKSNFEWLRIVSILFIVAHHFAMYATYSESMPTANRIVRIACFVLGKLGVNCFVLISGYFLLNSRFTWRKAFRLIVTVWFYSVVLYFTSLLFEGSFRWLDFYHALFSLVNGQYWFMTAYMIAYFLSPFLAILLRACTRAQHRLLLAFLFVIASVFGTFFSGTMLSMTGWFLFLMTLGSYLSSYPDFFRRIKPWIALLCWAALYSVIVAVYFFFEHNMADMIHPACVIWSLLFFAVFANANIKNNRIVNRIATCTLGIYMISDSPYIRPLLWKKWIPGGFHTERPTFILYTLSAIVLVWVVCTIVDFIREIAFFYIEKGGSTLLRRIKSRKSASDPTSTNEEN